MAFELEIHDPAADIEAACKGKRLEWARWEVNDLLLIFEGGTEVRLRAVDNEIEVHP